MSPADDRVLHAGALARERAGVFGRPICAMELGPETIQIVE